MKGFIGLIAHAHKRVGSFLHSQIGLVWLAGKKSLFSALVKLYGF